MKQFSINSTPLEDTGMLEASAGTGKTFSVAILVLRLILEKNIPIHKILMVTFTNAAVAELELRIREFVRKAFRYAENNIECDKEIMDVVDKMGKQDSLPKLKSALQSLDNLSVMTIHSFCQKTIGEFTFETNQSFDYEIVTEDNFILKSASNRFVREVLNVLDYEQFLEVTGKIKFDKLPAMLRKYLQGMEYADTDERDFDFEVRLKKERENYSKLKKAIEDNFEQIKKARIHGATNLAKKRESAEEFLPVFVNECCKKPPGTHAVKLTFIYEPFGREYAESALDTSLVYLHFLKKSAQIAHEKKSKTGLISYDDQIKTIHYARKKPQFIQSMNEKYDAVFIDEFQDTDKYQYEIFSELFEGKIMFYIGDPKQSIYGWRSADLDTYKIAKEKVGEKNIHTLDKNFRSTPGLLEALEKLMNPGNGFNMFQDDAIRFEPVKPGKKMGELEINGKPVAPITLWQFDANDFDSSNMAVAQEIYTLLTGDAKIEGEQVKPGDIGILVRENSAGRDIKKALAAFNIPSVQRDDTKVLKSDEAMQVSYLIQAALNPKRGDIFRAIHSKWFGFSSETLKNLDEQVHIGNFLKLRNVLQEKGVFNMIARFLDIYGVREKCASDIMGQRVLTNINQIAEILHRLERKAKLLPEDLLVWLQRAKDDGNEEYQQRIESDDDAVQISTIHKAKGLQYKIVFAPGLCIIPKKKLLEKNNINTFKKEGTYYFTFNYPGLSDDDKKLHDLEKEQENQRLIYVALTRAAYKCYISYMPRTYGRGNKKIKSSFDDLFTNFDRSFSGIELVDLTEGKPERIEGKYSKKTNEGDTSQKDGYQKDDPDKDTSKEEKIRALIHGFSADHLKVPLQLHSFSALNSKRHTTPFEVQKLEGEYNQFIFQDMPRGSTAGHALHSIFEHLHFEKPETWEQTLNNAAVVYESVLKQEWMEHFRNLIKYTMHAEISLNGETFQLAQVKDSLKLPELKFNFSFKGNVSKDNINKILGEDTELKGDAHLQGLMTGLVDLVFQHNNKYYILDWKSNYLGNTLEDYSPHALREAMKASNYTLQYTIYTIAVKRWLESRLPDFDYERDFGGVIYLYLRGIRQGKDTGIYFNKPEAEKIRALDAMLSGG